MRVEIGQFLWGVTLGGKLLRSLLVLYLGLNGFAWFFSERLIFVPPPSTYQDSPEILKLTTRNGKRISALHLRNPQATYTILYSHGNGSDIGSIRPVLETLRQIGFSVFAYDYQGYGTSQGTPSERNVYLDMEAAFAYLTTEQRIPANRIILYGFSVGSGPTIELAARQPVAGVILEGAFISTFRVMTHLPILPFDRFNNLSRIQSIRSPILVMHGTRDRVIPFYHGQTLYQQANPPKQFLWVEGADHNNLLEVAGNRYTQAIRDFVGLLKNREGVIGDR